jgi:hypothetical protein
MAETKSSILKRTKIFDFANVSTGEHINAHTVKIVQNSARYASGGESENVVIEGFLMEPINFDFDASWEKKEGIISSLLSNEIAQKILSPAEKVGIGVDHAGYVTKKYYTGGTDLKFNIQMRIVDYGGTGIVVLTVQRLAALMLPKQNATEISIASLAPDAAEKAQANATAQDAENSNSANAVVAWTGKTGLLSSSIAEITDAGITPTSAPTPVAIFIGEYFMNEDMVINSCGITFSKELIEIRSINEKANSDGSKSQDAQVFSAPLYVDLNINVSSRENLYLTKGMNDSKGTYINSTYWGYDAKVKRDSVNQSSQGRST